MKYYEAPNEYVPNGSASVFLAGGITGCPDWQRAATELFEGEDVAVLNPRRERSVGAAAVAEQIAWEYKHLRRASLVLFWFPDSVESVQPIALYELGMHAGLGTRIVVGADRSYSRRLDVELQLGLVRPELPIHDSLADTVRAAREGLRQAPATRQA
jgi:hypothetical protein